MGWAVGKDRDRDRFIGYGVPATCDHPGCGERIDRGLAYACGGGVVSSEENCGLFFCGKHLSYVEGRHEAVCDRCEKGEPPFDPTPDVAEWIYHLLTDESWQQWRNENPERFTALRSAL